MVVKHRQGHHPTGPGRPVPRIPTDLPAPADPVHLRLVPTTEPAIEGVAVGGRAQAGEPYEVEPHPEGQVSDQGARVHSTL